MNNLLTPIKNLTFKNFITTDDDRPVIDSNGGGVENRTRTKKIKVFQFYIGKPNYYTLSAE